MSRRVQVRGYMTEVPVCASPGEPLLRARDRMFAHRVRHLPVVDGQRLVGVVSARDIDTLQRCPGADPVRATVADAMIAEPFVASEEAALAEVVTAMAERRIGCAVIVDGHRRPRGMFTTVDALRAVARLLRRPSRRRTPTRERLVGRTAPSPRR